MKIKKVAAFLFNATVWCTFITIFALICCGFYEAIGNNQAKEIEPVPIRTAPSEPVAEQAVPAQSVHEPEVADEIEPEVIELECIIVEHQDPEPTYTEADLEMLALVIYQEAGADAYTDELRQMVGEVVLNRVADDRFPDTMEEVLTEVTEAGYGAYGRLHWTGIVWPERASYASEVHAVDRAYDIAEKLLSGSVERLLPEDVVFQAEFEQGTDCVEQQDGFFFCR